MKPFPFLSWQPWRKVHWLQIVVHVGALIPFAQLLWDFWQENLTINPIQEMTFRTGKAGLILLVLSLAATPVNILFGYRPALKVRRALGLYGFFYIALHFLIFVGLDYGFNLNLLIEAVFEKRYALVGFTAFLILIPLAITSTKGWMARLGKRWKQLHQAIYAACLLGGVHYVWLVKSDIREPLAYLAGIGILLVIRLAPVRRRLVNFRTRLTKRWVPGAPSR